MNSQDTLRKWIREQLETHGYGARVRLAEFLNLSPMQITNMLNLNTGQKARNILAEEWLKILLFFDAEEMNPAVPRAILEKDKPVIVSPPHSALRPADYVMLTKIFENDKPEQQEALSAIIRIYSSAKPKQREAIINIIRAFAETYDIPH